MDDVSVSPPPRLIGLAECCRRTSLSRTSIYREMKREDDPFPASVKISAFRSAWVEAEVDAWILRQIKARDAA